MYVQIATTHFHDSHVNFHNKTDINQNYKHITKLPIAKKLQNNNPKPPHKLMPLLMASSGFAIFINRPTLSFPFPAWYHLLTLNRLLKIEEKLIGYFLDADREH